MLALLLALCCSSPSETDWVEAYARDPEGTRKQVLALEDPIRQEAAILTLSEAHPGRFRKLCAELTEANVRDRCERINARPHLARVAEDRPEEPEPEIRPGGGPLRPIIPLPDDLPPPWPQVDPDPGPCDPDSARFHTCLEMEAIRAAEHGDVALGAARCRSTQDVLWRDECFFRIGESLPSGPDRLEVLTDVCRASESFFTECLAHGITRALPENARARSADPEDYAVLVQGADTLAGAWPDEHADVRALAVDLYWSLVGLHLYRADGEGVGNPFDHLPPAAHGHLRDNLARLYREHEDPLGAVREAMARRVESPAGDPPRRRVPDLKGLDGLWWCDAPGEEQIPAQFLFGMGCGRRPADPDPEIDLRMSVLTVVATRKPAPLELLLEHLDHDHPRIRWTAARLLGQMVPGHPGLKQAADDPHPLVQGRAEPVKCAGKRPILGSRPRGAPPAGGGRSGKGPPPGGGPAAKGPPPDPDPATGTRR